MSFGKGCGGSVPSRRSTTSKAEERHDSYTIMQLSLVRAKGPPRWRLANRPLANTQMGPERANAQSEKPTASGSKVGMNNRVETEWTHGWNVS